MSFIAEGSKSRLIGLSDDLHPQYLVTFGGKSAHREPEAIDAEEWIAKKGIGAKGKKCHSLDIKKVEFIEPLHKPEDDITVEEQAQPQDVIDLGIEQLPDEGPDLSDLPEMTIEEPTLF